MYNNILKKKKKSNYYGLITILVLNLWSLCQNVPQCFICVKSLCQVECDTSVVRIGAVLSQEGKLVAFFQWETLWSIMQMVNIWNWVVHCKYYLIQREFMMYMNHQVLTFIDCAPIFLFFLTKSKVYIKWLNN